LGFSFLYDDTFKAFWLGLEAGACSLTVILIFISQIVEIYPDLCYSITEVGQTGRFRLIMVKPTIDELAALKESTFKVQTPKGGSLTGYVT
jgi:hypothetical protein